MLGIFFYGPTVVLRVGVVSYTCIRGAPVCRGSKPEEPSGEAAYPGRF